MIHLPYRKNTGRSAFFFVAGCAALALVAAAWPGGLQPPVQASSKRAQAAGAAVFHDRGCQHCHGDDATGTDRGPDLSNVGKRWHKDRIEQQIRNGGGGMPPFGDVLHPDEVQSLVDYLSAKRKDPRKSAAPGEKGSESAKPPVVSKPGSDDSGD